jgi:hypothetical protein
MKQAVSRTRESLSSKIEGLVALTRTVDESTLENLETALLTSDLGVQTTTAILDALRDRARRQAIEGGEELRDLLKAQLRAILEAPQRPVPTPEAPPKVTFLVGVNGTGKTTSSGKLAAWYRNQGRSVLLCAADTFRAAAIEQLEIWASRSGVEMIKTRHGGDPAAVLYDAITAAKARKIDDLMWTPPAACTPRPASWTSWTRCAARPRADSRRAPRGAAGDGRHHRPERPAAGAAVHPGRRASPASCSPSWTARPRAASPWPSPRNSTCRCALSA